MCMLFKQLAFFSSADQWAQHLKISPIFPKGEVKHHGPPRTQPCDEPLPGRSGAGGMLAVRGARVRAA